jgi:signal transduction histidine kinase
MTLAEFIVRDMEGIISDWKQFARTIPAAASMDERELRDGVESILRRIASDMQQSQSKSKRESKSRGEQDTRQNERDSAAQEHAADRLSEGFTLPEMVSEYRALRASVIRRWTSEVRPGPQALDELIRFDEGIDQALAESITRFTEKLDRARELFMGTLGHDLRSPLQVITQCARYLSQPETTTRKHSQLGGYISESAEHIRNMVEDLLDLARTKLGGSLPIDVSSTDITKVCCAAVNELRIAHPSVTFVTHVPPTLIGNWDSSRLRQLATNLLKNAIQHGDATRPVSLSVKDEGERVLIEVFNEGKPIPEGVLKTMFEPLARGETMSQDQRGANMGLGLFISNTIAHAHRGTITVDSGADRGTTFTVCLPRDSATQ